MGHIVCAVLAFGPVISGFVPYNLVNPAAVAVDRIYRGIYFGVCLVGCHFAV